MIFLGVVQLDNAIITRDGMNSGKKKWTMYFKCDRNGKNISTVKLEERTKNTSSKNCGCGFELVISLDKGIEERKPHNAACIAMRSASSFRARDENFAQRTASPPPLLKELEEHLVKIMRGTREVKRRTLRQVVLDAYREKDMAAPNESFINTILEKADAVAFPRISDDELVQSIIRDLEARKLKYKVSAKHARVRDERCRRQLLSILAHKLTIVTPFVNPSLNEHRPSRKRSRRRKTGRRWWY